MLIVQMTIENCKSFKAKTTIEFDKALNILVGPNGGGKSNALDILTIVLYKFFIWGYTSNVPNTIPAKGNLPDIKQQQIFNDISTHLEKYTGQENLPMKISFKLQVQAVDIQNIKSIITNRTSLQKALSKYKDKPYTMDLIHSWNPSTFHEGQQFSYEIVDHKLQEPKSGTPEHTFLLYLQTLEFFLLLSRYCPEIDIRPCLLYFSPYRVTNAEDFQVSLSAENYYQTRTARFSATSHLQTSLIKIAISYFAEKRRKIETNSHDISWQKLWEEDPEVRLVTKYMRYLGYKWELKPGDILSNIYEIILQKDGRELRIPQASSGEKEILNFLFGVFAFGVFGGLIIIDEPELHLHPKWQEILRDLFLEMAILTKNQFVISTHSPVFLTPETLSNVRRVSMNTANATKFTQVSTKEIENKRALLHIVNSHNNERMFFADKVVLVEGIKDRLIFETLIHHYRTLAETTEIIEVLEVHGKGNFYNYTEFLKGLEVPVSIIADQDYLANIHGGRLSDLFETQLKKIDDCVLNDKNSDDRRTLSEHLDKAIADNDLSELRKIWDYIKARHTIIKSNLNGEENSRLNAFLDELKKKNTFILSEGEIEKYLPVGSTQLEQVITLVQEGLQEWLRTSKKDSRLCKLQEIVFDILHIPQEKRASLAGWE